ncbi:MAG TPA: SRPBCC family protein [Blastocatellia bacterium]|nr:SRPBCC family protein [Blastocatellia bacterium]
MWEFEHSVETKASRAFAWRFWTDVSNWAFDSSIEWVRLEGPFASGTMGETKSPGLDPVRWELKGVRAGEEAVVEMALPGATLRFHWRFEDTAERGTRITQRASLDGPAADDLVNQGVREFERGIPDGMRKLADLISESARSSSQSPD